MINILELEVNTVKEYLRIDHTDDDLMIDMFLVAAKSYIQNYLNQKFTEMQSNGDGIPDALTIPCLALISHWYEYRAVTTNSKSDAILHTFSSILDNHRIFYGGELI